MSTAAVAWGGTGGGATVVAAPVPGATGGSGWLYNLLTRSGVDPSTAQQVNELVIRPLEVLIVVVVAIVVAHVGARWIRRLLLRLGHPAVDRMGSPRTAGRVDTVVALVANIWRFVVALVAIGIILTIFGINLTPLLASATVLGATIGFGAQSLVRDYLSGVLLTVEDQFGIGDAISVNDTTGVVEDLSLRVTRLRGGDGTLWSVPNGDIRRLGNTSRGWVEARIDVAVPLHDAADLDRARRLLLEAATATTTSPPVSEWCPQRPSVVGVVEAADGTATLRLAVRTVAAHQSGVECAVREAAVRSLLEAELWPEPSAVASDSPGSDGDAPAGGGGG